MNRLTKMDRRGFYTNKATCRNIFESDGDWFKGECTLEADFSLLTENQ